MKGIYALVWLATTGDKIYIGSSVGIANRLKAHLCHLRRGNHDNQYAQHLFQKYGEPSLKIIEEFDGTESDLRLLESDWLDLVPENRRVNLGPILPSTAFGRRHTDETKLKISEAKKGTHLTFSDEHRRHISEAKKGNCYKRGKTASDETKRKLSESKKGKPLSDETRRKLSESLLGRTLSDEHRRNISECLKGNSYNLGKPSPKRGITLSDEHCLKLSESHKKYWATRKLNESTQS